jgi:heme-degrading monooxygenase HmoA
MYATIRTAKIAPGTGAELARRIKETMVSSISSLPGFISYTILATADDTFATVTIFQNQASVEESNRKAQEWVKQYAAELVLTPMQFVSGEVLMHVGS